jgi:hypothetical protein
MSTSFNIVWQTGVPIPAAIACSWKLALAGGVFSALGMRTIPREKAARLLRKPMLYRTVTPACSSGQTLARSEANQDGILDLRGSGKELWADEHADDYVRRLREVWE